MKNMEQQYMNNQNLHILDKLTNVHSSTRIIVTHLLLSISVFSFVFSHSYWLYFLHSLNFCLSTFPYQLVTHTMDKNCMFLLCNGLLVFLAKYSGLLRSLSLSSSPHDESDNNSNKSAAIADVSQPDHSPILPMNKEILEFNEANVEDNEREVFFTNQGEITKVDKPIMENNKEEEDQRSEVVDSKDSKQIEDEEDEESALVHEEEYQEEEEELGINEKLSTEELNKKFDEFIRKTKQELRIEAQRHLLVMV